MINRDFFARSVHEIAPDLIGVTLLVDGVGGRIVEVEAYDQEDPASHGYRGRTVLGARQALSGARRHTRARRTAARSPPVSTLGTSRSAEDRNRSAHRDHTGDRSFLALCGS
jgi:hypothetical protein